MDALTNYDSEAVVIVHVDQKVNIEPFAFACKKYSRCSFLKRRNRVSWGGFSILKVQIELLREAITNANSKIGRFVFLSGLDFPIASPARINAFFTEHPDTEFVGGLISHHAVLTPLYGELTDFMRSAIRFFLSK